MNFDLFMDNQNHLEDTDVVKQRISLRYLFGVMTYWAIGFAFAGNTDLPILIRLFGVGLCGYWIAKPIFAASKRFEPPLQELVFLLAFLIYVGSLLSIGTGTIAILVSLMIYATETLR